MTHWWFHIYFDRGKLLSRTARATRSPISLHQPTYSHTIKPFPHILTCYKSISPYTWIVWNFCAQNPPYEIYTWCENLCRMHKYYQTYPSTWSHTIFNVLPKSNTIPTKGANYVPCVICIYFLKAPDCWLIIRNLLVAQISIAYVWIRIFGYASSSMTECRQR